MFAYPYISTQDSEEDINSFPETIQRKLSLLHHQERRIIYLKYHLNILEDQHRLLKEELAPYLAPVRQRPPNSGTTQVNYLDRLPDEVLYIIFKEYLSEEHHNIWRLLLVCRRWNRLIMGRAAFWAKIQISWDHPIFYSSPLYSPISYIIACVERSRPLLLEIDLNFQNFRSSEEFLRTEMVQAMRTLIEDSHYWEIDDESADWNMNWPSPLYDLSVERLFDCLIGVNGEHMDRWSSVTINASCEPSVAADIWSKFKGAIPNLKTFTIGGFPIKEDNEYNLEIFKKGFIDLSSVTNLIILGGPPVSSYPISHTTLQHLSMTLYNGLSNLVSFSTLSNLRTLKLRGETYGELPNLANIPFIIRLPCLEKLELSGRYSWLYKMKLDLPRLDKLAILTCGSFYNLPKLSPKSISWDISAWVDGDMTEIFHSILSVSQNLEKITMSVSPELRSRILKEIEQCRANGKLLISPYVITFTPTPLEEKFISQRRQKAESTSQSGQE